MVGGSLPDRKGVKHMTVFESLMLMIAFGTLIVAILSFSQKK
ncbi:putative holin-like toxin [Aneurinibacillus migulanus]